MEREIMPLGRFGWFILPVNPREYLSPKGPHQKCRENSPV
uniref:Uncharacterized protein n=1 Tax=Rhizophora mucronata TaxID=61149 RepID=A0A2P2NR59_RHIMU